MLRTRNSELKALFHLPTHSKDRILPIFLIRPVPNANHLALTFEKIDEAFDDRSFVCDLDPMARGGTSTKPAQAEFDALFEPAEGFANYYDLLAEHEFALPVLRSSSATLGVFQEELERIEALGRRLFVRIQQGDNSSVNFINTAEFEQLPQPIFWLDIGWSPNLDLNGLWAQPIINRILEVFPDAEIVFTGSSFPDSFTDIGEQGSKEIRELTTFRNLRAANNMARLYFGDWGSTRPPADQNGAGQLYSRIDVPVADRWYMYRTVGSGNYRELAEQATADSSWPAGLDIWGTNAIMSSAIGLPGGISGQQMAAAVRINIHLHLMAQGGELNFSDDEEEIFDDD